MAVVLLSRISSSGEWMRKIRVRYREEVCAVHLGDNKRFAGHLSLDRITFSPWVILCLQLSALHLSDASAKVYQIMSTLMSPNSRGTPLRLLCLISLPINTIHAQ